MWKVGKKIICIKSHSQGIIKEGNTFILRGIYENICKCKILKFDIGLKTDKFISFCPICQNKCMNEEHFRNIWLFNENLFKPLDEDYAEEICENFEKEFNKKKLELYN
jgi:hypothetical protein